MESKQILNLIQNKMQEEQEVKFLIDILKEKYVDQIKKERRIDPQICYMVDFHEAWLSQNKSTEEEKKPYNQLLFALEHFVFYENWKKIQIKEIVADFTDSLTVEFIYKKHKFNLYLPNYSTINRFEDCLADYLDYRIGYYDTEYSVEIFKKYETLHELGNNIVKDMNDKIEGEIK